jgi:hypothetical protein
MLPEGLGKLENIHLIVPQPLRYRVPPKRMGIVLKLKQCEVAQKLSHVQEPCRPCWDKSPGILDLGSV